MSTQAWIQNYIEGQKQALDSIPTDKVEQLLQELKALHAEDRKFFVFGNGGSASNASHFICDLGKGSSDALGKRFNCLSLNDNISWMTAIGNDYCYEDIFVRQLENYATEGDMVLTMSVSGSSPNLVKAFGWCKEHGVKTWALIGGKRGKLFELADEVIVIEAEHYGRVEDAQMTISHMACYAFMEGAV